MVSEWMANGNIREFVGMHRDVNRLKLVCYSCATLLRLLIVQNYVTSVDFRRRQGAGLSTRPGGDPWGPQGGVCLKVRAEPLPR